MPEHERKSEKKATLSGDTGTVAHRHAIMWRLGLIYTRERGRCRVKSISSLRRIERLLKREAPNWKPATVLRHVLMLRFMSTEYYALNDFLVGHKINNSNQEKLMSLY